MTDTTDAGQFDILAELTNAVRIIDYACEQGAFKGWDTITQVHGVRSRMNAFIAAMEEAVTAQNAAKAAAASEVAADQQASTSPALKAKKSRAKANPKG